MRISTDPDRSSGPHDYPLGGATSQAQHAATEYSIPQTTYRNADSQGWWHTHPFAPQLDYSEVHATWLPLNYFS